MTELEKALGKTLSGLEQELSAAIEDHEQRLSRQEAALQRLTADLREYGKLFNNVGELYGSLQALLLQWKNGA
jgi:hypothetical protein